MSKVYFTRGERFMVFIFCLLVLAVCARFLFFP